MREGGRHVGAENFLGALRLRLNPVSTSQRPLRIEDAAVKTPGPFILQLGAKDNGQSVSVGGAGD